MKRLNKKILGLTLVHLNQSYFINEEVRPSVRTTYICNNCNCDNEIEIKPFQTGFPFKEVYENALLTEEQILEAGIATRSSEWAANYGKYLVANLSTIYFVASCEKCGKDHLTVFGFGESQPGRTECVISGVWEIKME